MSAIDKVLDLGAKKEKIEKSILDLSNDVFEQFINLPYSVEKISTEKGKKLSLCTKDEYYPILDLPKDFTKVDEEFKVIIGFPKKCVRHSYILKDVNEREVKVTETARLYDTICIKNGHISLNFFIPIGQVEYNLLISNTNYEFSRSFNEMDILNNIVECKEATIVNYPFNKAYIDANIKYEKFLKSFKSKKNIPPLKNFSDFPSVKLNIAPGLKADINISKEPYKDSIKFQNPQFTVILLYKNSTKFTYILKPYFVTGIKIEEQKYEYIQLENGGYINNKITLEELI